MNVCLISNTGAIISINVEESNQNADDSLYCSSFEGEQIEDFIHAKRTIIVISNGTKLN